MNIKLATVLSIVVIFYFVYDSASNYGVFAETITLLLAAYIIQEIMYNK